MLSGAIFGLNAVLNLGLMLALARILAPASYGALAIWSAGGLFVATASFDWLRFSAMRFYTPASRRDEPAVRATLDASFAACIPPAIGVIGLFAAFGLLPDVTPITTIGLAGFAIGNAANEYFAALCRNLADTRTYARFVTIRHAFTLVGGLGAAYATRDPHTTILVLGGAVWPSVIFAAIALRDPRATWPLWTLTRTRMFAIYGLPVIAAEALFQAIGLMNRLWLTAHVDLAAAGIYSLTVDLAFKIVAVMASVAEAALLPRLIAREADLAGHVDGPSEVQAGLRRVVFTLLGVSAATGLGFWLAAPLAVPVLFSAAFRVGFLSALGPALVCACLYVLQTYVLRPIFQIGLQTTPLLYSALLAFVLDGLMLTILKADNIGAVLAAQAIGLSAGAVLLLARAMAAQQRPHPVALAAN